MSKQNTVKTVRPAAVRIGPRGHGMCWAEHPRTSVHCIEPIGHSGTHWHPYTKTRWT